MVGLFARDRVRSAAGMSLGASTQQGLGTVVLAVLGVLVLFEAPPASATAACTGYCKDECYRLSQENWNVSSTTAEVNLAAPRVIGNNISYYQSRQVCGTGSVRVRRLDSNGKLLMRCVNLQGCGTSAKGVRICSSLGTDKYLSFKCATCAGTITASGECQ